MSELRLVDTPGELESYLNFLFDGLEGYVCVALGDRNAAHKIENWEEQFFQWPAEHVRLSEFIQTTTISREVYVAPAIWDMPRAKKENFKSSNVVWCELDDRRAESLPAPGSVDWELYNVPTPSLRIQSSHSGNEHWYWRLDNPITEALEVESINRALAASFQADSSGWDATQVLRPPQTLNHKRNKLVTSILVLGTSQYATDLFQRLHPSGPPTEIDTTTIPDVSEIIFRYSFPDQVQTIFKSTPGEGERSTALMSLGYQLAEMGLSDVEIFSVVRNADDRWGKFSGRADRNQRLSDLIARVRIKVPAILSNSSTTSLQSFGFRSLLESDIELKWLIPDVLESGGYMLLTGPSGVGKTQWSLRWAINLALGKRFLDSELTSPIPVVFFSLEMGHAPLKFFLSQMVKDLTDEEIQILEKNLQFIPLGESLYLDTIEHQKLFTDVMDRHKPEVVFVDSLGSSTTGDLVEGPIKQIMDFNDRIRQRYNCATWFIHHQRKAQSDNRKPNKQSDVYGGIYLVNRSTSCFCLWPNQGDIEIIELKKRLAPLKPNWRVQRTENLNFVRMAEVTLGLARRELEFKQPDHPVIITSDGQVLEVTKAEVIVDDFVQEKTIKTPVETTDFEGTM